MSGTLKIRGANRHRTRDDLARGERETAKKNCPKLVTKLPGGGQQNRQLMVIRSARHVSVYQAPLLRFRP
jgi:hypothetical protein